MTAATDRHYRLTATYGRTTLTRTVPAPDWGAAMFHAQACLARVQREHPRSAWNRAGAAIELRNPAGEVVSAFVVRAPRGAA